MNKTSSALMQLTLQWKEPENNKYTCLKKSLHLNMGSGSKDWRRSRRWGIALYRWWRKMSLNRRPLSSDLKWESEEPRAEQVQGPEGCGWIPRTAEDARLVELEGRGLTGGIGGLGLSSEWHGSHWRSFAQNSDVTWPACQKTKTEQVCRIPVNGA